MMSSVMYICTRSGQLYQIATDPSIRTQCSLTLEKIKETHFRYKTVIGYQEETNIHTVSAHHCTQILFIYQILPGLHLALCISWRSSFPFTPQFSVLVKTFGYFFYLLLSSPFFKVHHGSVET